MLPTSQPATAYPDLPTSQPATADPDLSTSQPATADHASPTSQQSDHVQQNTPPEDREQDPVQPRRPPKTVFLIDSNGKYVEDSRLSSRRLNAGVSILTMHYNSSIKPSWKTTPQPHYQLTYAEATSSKRHINPSAIREVS